MKDMSNMGYNTKLIHAGPRPDPVTGALSTPILGFKKFIM